MSHVTPHFQSIPQTARISPEVFIFNGLQGQRREETARKIMVKRQANPAAKPRVFQGFRLGFRASQAPSSEALHGSQRLRWMPLDATGRHLQG